MISMLPDYSHPNGKSFGEDLRAILLVFDRGPGNVVKQGMQGWRDWNS